jgi:hypothetical protein
VPGRAPFEETPNGESAFGEAQKGATVADKPCTAAHPNNKNNEKNNAGLQVEFEQWWELFPRRVGKGHARRAFEKIVQAGGVSIDELKEGAKRYAAECAAANREPRYIKHPATWLNGECWADEPLSMVTGDVRTSRTRGKVAGAGGWDPRLWESRPKFLRKRASGSGAFGTVIPRRYAHDARIGERKSESRAYQLKSMIVAWGGAVTTAIADGEEELSMKTLGPIGLEMFERRGISPETVVRFGIYTVSCSNGAVVPDDRGNIIAFPFGERGVVVAEKYRAPGKKFWQRPGGRRTSRRRVHSELLGSESVQNWTQWLLPSW